MLLYRHDLYGIVAVFGYTGKYQVAELGIGADALGLLRHAYVALIYEERARVRDKLFDFPLVSLFRLPYLGREHMCHIILHHTGGIGRDAFALESRKPVRAKSFWTDRIWQESISADVMNQVFPIFQRTDCQTV